MGARLATLTFAALTAILSIGNVAGQERTAQLDVPALIRAGRFEQAESAARAHVDAVRAATHDDAVQVAAANDTLLEALILNGHAASSEVLQLATRTLHAKESRLGTDHRDLVPSLLNLGDALIAAGDFDQAIAVTQRAVTVCERDGNGADGTIELARALDHLGSALSARRRHSEALKSFTRSLAIKEHLLTPLDTEIARTLEGMTLILQREAAYTQSGALVRRAASIHAAADPNHPAYTVTLNLLAQQLWFEGDLPASKAASERAVAHAERTLRHDHPTIALSLRYLAATVCDLGEAAECLGLTRRALDVAQNAFGAGRPGTGEYLNDLGFVEFDEGDYQTGRSLLQQSLAIYEAHYGPWHEYVAGSLTGLARAETRLGNYETAAKELSRVVAIHSRVEGPNHPYVAMALTDLASVYTELGLHSRARLLLERALAIRERSLGPDHRDVARTLADLATTLMQLGQKTRAQRLATRSLRIWEQLNAPEAPAYATILALYAKLQLERGKGDEAREYFERALTIRAKVFGQSHPLYAEAQTGLAHALAAGGDAAGAIRAASAAETTGRAHLSLMLRSLSEREALNYAAARPRGLDLILSLAPSTPGVAPIALDGLIRTRALVLDEIAARRAARHDSIDTAAPRTTVIAAQQRLANLIVRGPGQLSPMQYQAAVASARRESEAAEQALAAASVEFRAARSRAQIGLDEVNAAVPAGAALVAFARYQRTSFTDNASHTIPAYVGMILRHDEPPTIVRLGSAQSIDTLVSQWRVDILARSSRASGTALRRRVWDPVATHLSGVSRVFIVPDGELGLVPFAALPAGTRSYLLETGPVIHYLSAERDLVPSLEARATGRGLLALGGPSFNDSSVFRNRTKSTSPPTVANAQAIRGGVGSCGNFQSASFLPLNGTLREVRAIKDIWTANPATALEPVRLLVGRDANETTLKRDAPGARVLHVATHGFFLNGTCATEPTTTRGVGGLAKKQPTDRVADNPLRLSGLALAGANRRGSAGPDEDEGILLAEEVASLDLEGVEWAVLSACDTGVGEIKVGEGILGLRRSFQVAGARTVIMSLWSVDDDATREWMRAVYEARFVKKLTTADAVHAANITVLRARRAKGRSTEPFYWAAFVAAGAWR